MIEKWKKLSCSLLNPFIAGSFWSWQRPAVSSQRFSAWQSDGPWCCGSFATQPLPVCNTAWKQGLQTLLSYYTSTKSISTEKQAKWINLSFGTQDMSILIFRFKQEVTLEVSIPFLFSSPRGANARYCSSFHCRFWLCSKAIHTVTAWKASLCNIKQLLLSSSDTL